MTTLLACALYAVVLALHLLLAGLAVAIALLRISLAVDPHPTLRQLRRDAVILRWALRWHWIVAFGVGLGWAVAAWIGRDVGVPCEATDAGCWPW